METAEEKWVGYVLMEAEKKKSIFKVLSMERKNAVDKGGNYISDIHRLKVRVLTNSGDVEERSVIYKKISVDGKDKLPGIRELGLFEIEAKLNRMIFQMYQVTLAAMGRLLKSKDKEEEVLWPEFYGAKGNFEGFLLEDLSVIGYSLGDKVIGHDFDHASTVLEFMAKFHALGAVAIENGYVTESDFDTYFLLRSRQIVQTVFTNAFRELADLLEHTWKGEWVAVAKNIRIFKQTLTDKMIDLLKTDPCKLKTVCHGDCWVNNIMVKYSRMGRPQSVRFVDFQTSFVGSPGGDLQYYFGNSLREDTIPRKRELLELYHAALDDYLQQFGYRGERLSLEELIQAYEHYNVLGVAAAIGIRPLIGMHGDDLPDKEGIIRNLCEGSDKPLFPFGIKAEYFVNILKMGITEGIKLGFF